MCCVFLFSETTTQQLSLSLPPLFLSLLLLTAVQYISSSIRDISPRYFEKNCSLAQRHPNSTRSAGPHKENESEAYRDDPIPAGIVSRASFGSGKGV